jgi:hypothetical protein
LWTAVLHVFAIAKNENFVGVDDGLKSVSDGDDSEVFELLVY